MLAAGWASPPKSFATICSTARSASSPAQGPASGRASAIELARLGATVIGCGRRPEPIEETAAMIDDAGGKAEAEAMDIRDEEAVDALVDEVLERHGRLDVLVNNAGGQFLSPAEAITPKGLSHRDRAERRRAPGS